MITMIIIVMITMIIIERNIVIMKKYCNDCNLSNIHEVIMTVFNFLQKYSAPIKSMGR